MRILVVGGFNTDPKRIYLALDAVRASYPFTELLQATYGSEADRCAGEWAKRRGVPIVKPENITWNIRRPRTAAPLRNAAVLAMKPDLLIAFKHGTGTMDMIRRAKALNIKIIRMDFS
jgi:YspA, cpYpsA-related SLOG family